jgi:hypothetical protein
MRVPHRHQAALGVAHVSLLVAALSLALWLLHISTGTASSMIVVVVAVYGGAAFVIVRATRRRAAAHDAAQRRNQRADKHGWGTGR